jgi:hypothetical protein
MMKKAENLNSNIRHDGILSIRNFMLMINNNFARFQLPGNLLKTKKCAPYFRGNTQFPIYYKPFIVSDWFKLRDIYICPEKCVLLIISGFQQTIFS